MKLMKTILTLLVISALAFSCKSDKEKVVDEVTDTVEAAAEETEEAMEEAAEEVEEEAEEAADEVSEAVAEKKITVVFPKDTKLQNEVQAALAEFAASIPL